MTCKTSPRRARPAALFPFLSLLCLVSPLFAAEPAVSFNDAFGVKFDRPVVLAEIPGRAEEFLVVEQSGKIQRLFKDGNRWKKSEFAAFKVLGGKRWEDERGLLGLAFHPKFAENRLYYVNYVSALENTLVEERKARDDATRDSETHRRVILEIEQPYGNHNGGTIGFGPDGYFYVGMGDGGSGGDPHNHAQDPQSLLGKMLRIDVTKSDSGKAYGIPQDNPFAKRKGYLPEIWALGLRNPWKWTFHPVTGSLWVGDVGQGDREEISIVPRGGNMGWRRLEGDRCFEGNGCNRKGMVSPLISLPRSEARSITGGEFFTANRASRHNGSYVFGDYVTGTVWTLRRRSGRWERTVIGEVPSVSAFARDGRGNVYALGLKDGVIRKLGL
jgi:glucose/arabinose dehydrogenase